MIYEEKLKHFVNMVERAMRWKDSDPLRAMGALEKTAGVIRESLESMLSPLMDVNLAAFDWYNTAVAEAEYDRKWWERVDDECMPGSPTLADIKRAVRCTCSRMWLPHAPTDKMVEETRELYYRDGIAQGDDATAEQLMQWVRLCPITPFDSYLFFLTQTMQDEWLHLVDYAHEEGQIDRKQRKSLRKIDLDQYCLSDQPPALTMADILSAPQTGQKQQPTAGAAHFTKRVSDDELTAIFNGLMEHKMLCDNPSLADFIYWHTGSGERPQSLLKWATKNVCRYYVQQYLDSDWSTAEQCFSCKRGNISGLSQATNITDRNKKKIDSILDNAKKKQDIKHD